MLRILLTFVVFKFRRTSCVCLPVSFCRSKGIRSNRSSRRCGVPSSGRYLVIACARRHRRSNGLSIGCEQSVAQVLFRMSPRYARRHPIASHCEDLLSRIKEAGPRCLSGSPRPGCGRAPVAAEDRLPAGTDVSAGSEWASNPMNAGPTPTAKPSGRP